MYGEDKRPIGMIMHDWTYMFMKWLKLWTAMQMQSQWSQMQLSALTKTLVVDQIRKYQKLNFIVRFVMFLCAPFLVSKTTQKAELLVQS